MLLIHPEHFDRSVHVADVETIATVRKYQPGVADLGLAIDVDFDARLGGFGLFFVREGNTWPLDRRSIGGEAEHEQLRTLARQNQEFPDPAKGQSPAVVRGEAWTNWPKGSALG